MTTFTEATRLYLAARDASTRDGRRLRRVCGLKLEDLGRIGDANVTAIKPMHVTLAARLLYPGDFTNQTRNREVIAPVSAVLNFATENDLGLTRRVKRMEEVRPLSRRPAVETVDRLIDATAGEQRALLVFLAFQGWRISEALSLEWPHVDFAERTLAVYVGKARTEKLVVMHPRVELELHPLAKPTGTVFPWPDARQVYAWLNPLAERLGVRFTPHMARHHFASRVFEMGGGTKGCVKIGTWTSEASLGRYINPTDDYAHGLIAKL